MMNALPPEGRKLLMRDQSGVRVFDRVSSSRIRTALSAGESGHCVICVEDAFAQSLLREILRRFDPHLLECTAVLPFGDNRAVVSAKKALAHTGQRVIAVLDGDQHPNAADNIFCLPGKLPPEKDVFQSDAAKTALREKYSFEFDALMTAYPAMDHHVYSSHIAKIKNCSREVLESDCIRAFLDQAGNKWFEDLCMQIKSKV